MLLSHEIDPDFSNEQKQFRNSNIDQEQDEDFDSGAPPLDITLPELSKPFQKFIDVDHHNHIEDVDNDELEEIEVERLKNFLAEDLETKEEVDQEENLNLERKKVSAEDIVPLDEESDFITFPMDNTFPTQDFSAFVDFQDF